MKGIVSIVLSAFVVFSALKVADFADVLKEPKSCEIGSWGNPCTKCECGDKAEKCDYATGKCFCNTKGVIGDKCDQCDEKKRYKGEGCYYDIDESIKYNFKLINPQNANYTRVNFKLSPEDKNENIHFRLACIENCTTFELKMTVKENGKAEKFIVEHRKLSDKTAFEKLLPAKDFKFGMEKEKPVTEFHINIYNFKTPIVFEVTAIPESQLKEKTLITLNES